MKIFSALIAACVISSGIFAQDLSGGAEAYAKGNYVEAAEAYDRELSKGVSAELYYNLGNAYYKSGKTALAILNYERALELAPGDGDIRANLELAQSKITDKIEPVETFFAVQWFHDIQDLQSSDAWAKSGIVLFILMICCSFLFFFGRFSILRKAGFYVGIALLVCAGLSNIFANNRKKIVEQKKYAIIFAPSITVKSSPNPGGTDLFVIHEGLKVRIKNTLNDWAEIELADGNVGWVSSSLLEQI
ncbi:MAG: tetratricopeptide repeat protein [Candidatus Azobacteroides sp.]|nr:tetratricopeptide repeat protein [Candidatus Azobacteroides sp.]